MKESYTLYTNQLNEEYRPVFDKVELYLVTKYIDDVTKEEQLSELLDLFLTAQEAGKPVQKMVGNNLERFCQTFCSDYGWKNRLFNELDSLKRIAWWLLIVSMLDMLPLITDYAAGKADFWQEVTSLNLSGYLIGLSISALLSWVAGFITRWIMFRLKRVSMKVLQGIILATAIISFVLILALLFSEDTNFWSCPAWLLALLSGGYLALYYLFHHKRLKEQKQQKIRFRDMINAEMAKTFPSEMEKKFDRANRRSIKKGKGPLSLEAFLDKEEKDCQLTERLKLLYDLTPIVIVGFAVLATCSDGGFESLPDAILFIAIMLIMEYAIMRCFWKITKKGVEERRAWIQSKRAQLEAVEDSGETQGILKENENA